MASGATSGCGKNRKHTEHRFVRRRGTCHLTAAFPIENRLRRIYRQPLGRVIGRPRAAFVLAVLRDHRRERDHALVVPWLGYYGT